MLGTILLATAQFANAAEGHQSRKTDHVIKPTSDQFRNSNAAWPVRQAQTDWSRYSGGYSAPAGH